MARFESSKLVPNLINPESEVLFVGEAPGEDELYHGEPFVGRAGQALSFAIEHTFKLPRSAFSFANLCQRRPYKNKFTYALDSEELASGLTELAQQIVTHKNLKLIVALGNWPMYFLTGTQGQKPGTGISDWRGSFIANTLTPDGPPILVTYHPAFIIRPNGYTNKPIFFSDLAWAKKYLDDPSIFPWNYSSYIDPPLDVLETLCSEISSSSSLVAVDIETFRDGSLSCIGFSDSTTRGLCLTYESSAIWKYAPILLASQAPKVFQYGKFDIEFLRRNYGWATTNYAWDTYIASSNLLPEFPRGLDFLTSIYTPLPYYKNERKVWKETGNQNTLWEYNIKDVIATLMIAIEQQHEIEELWPGGSTTSPISISGTFS